jgi:hypothetical protein
VSPERNLYPRLQDRFGLVPRLLVEQSARLDELVARIESLSQRLCLNPLLRGPALVVEADDGAVGPGQGGDDEAHPRKQLSEVMLDLGDHPPWPSQEAA